MKTIVRFVAAATLAVISSPISNTAEASCHIPQPDHYCGVACYTSGYCVVPSTPDMYCIELGGGCGSNKRPECCPGGFGLF